MHSLATPSAVRASYWRSRFCASPALETRAYPIFMSYTVVCDVFMIGPRGAAVHVSYYLSYSEYRNRVRFPKDTGRPRRTVFASRQGFPVRSPSRQEHPRVNVPAIALSDTLSDGAFALPDPLPPAQLCNPSSGAKTGTD